MKKSFWLVSKITVFYISNFGNQRLIHHIRCFGCKFYHQSMIKKFCWLHRFLLYDLYLGFYSSNFSNISYSRKHLCIHYDLLLQTCFYSHPLLFYAHYYHLQKNKYIFGFSPINSLIATPAVSSFILATTIFFKYHNIFTQPK